MTKDLGFTIVKLLIVIVAVAALATLAIVIHNNNQNHTKTTSAQLIVSTVLEKAQAYNAERASYPISFTILTGAASTATYRLTGVTSVASLTNTSPTNNIKFEVCGSRAPALANLTAITASNVTGVRVSYRDYAKGSNATLLAGATSSSAIACFDSTGDAIK